MPTRRFIAYIQIIHTPWGGTNAVYDFRGYLVCSLGSGRGGFGLSLCPPRAGPT